MVDSSQKGQSDFVFPKDILGGVSGRGQVYVCLFYRKISTTKELKKKKKKQIPRLTESVSRLGTGPLYLTNSSLISTLGTLY